jgi:hypothetical protein
VDGLGAGPFRDCDDGVDVEVTLPCGCRPDADRQIGLRDVAGTGVGVAEHGNRADAHRAQRANYPDRDLAAVGYQNGIELHHHIRNTP